MSDFIPVPGRGRGAGRGGRNRNYAWRGGHGRGRGNRRGRGRGRQQRRQWGGRRSSGPDGYVDKIEELGTRSDVSLCVAVEGCCHGELDAIYHRLKQHEEKSGQKVDLLLCCGDFQSLRNTADYHSFAVPPKYRSLGSFHRYYSGEKEAPILTVFIGGNHEASQPLQELHHGGWVAPNIYYLGAAGVVNVAGVRIGGISGIYKSHDYTQGRFERPPYDRSTLRSVYHVRNDDVYRLKCLCPDKRLDIFLSHDWPQGIEQHGDTATLLRQKPYFRDEVQRNDLGSPPNRDLMDTLKPKWWFSGHLHVKFKAQVEYGSESNQASKTEALDPTSLVPSQVQPPTKSVADSDKALEAAASKQEPAMTTTQFRSLESSSKVCCGGPDLTDLMTQFLALDKCLPRRQYLSIVHVPCNGRKDVLEYDAEWLAILKKTHGLTCAEKRRVHCPPELVRVTDDEIDFVRTRLNERRQDDAEADNPLVIPNNFTRTVSPQGETTNSAPLPWMGNPQTDEFLDLLGLEHIVTIPFNSASLDVAVQVEADDNEIDLEEDDDEIALEDDNEIDLEDDNEIDVEEQVTEQPAESGASTDQHGIVLDYEGVTNNMPADGNVHASKKARTNS